MQMSFRVLTSWKVTCFKVVKVNSFFHLQKYLENRFALSSAYAHILIEFYNVWKTTSTTFIRFGPSQSPIILIIHTLLKVGNKHKVFVGQAKYINSSILIPINGLVVNFKSIGYINSTMGKTNGFVLTLTLHCFITVISYQYFIYNPASFFSGKAFVLLPIGLLKVTGHDSPGHDYTLSITAQMLTDCCEWLIISGFSLLVSFSLKSVSFQRFSGNSSAFPHPTKPWNVLKRYIYLL